MPFITVTNYFDRSPALLNVAHIISMCDEKPGSYAHVMGGRTAILTTAGADGSCYYQVCETLADIARALNPPAANNDA